MSVSAIIPAWNGRALLAKLLDCLKRQTQPPAEVLVIDNGSHDGAPELAEAWGARVIRLGSNTGFAHAVNIGIAESRSEWLAILNSDVELHPDWLEKLTSTDAWFACGKIFSAQHPGILDGSFDLICRGGCPWRAGHGRPDQPPFSQTTEIHMAPMTAAVFRAQLFRHVGLLDETFESYLEDVDFGMRCAARGYRGIYIPEAAATHQGSATLGRWHSDSVRRMSRNQVFLIAKHYPGVVVRAWLWNIVFAQLLWGLVATRYGAGVGFVQGKWEGLRRWRQLRTNEPIPRQILSDNLGCMETQIQTIQRQIGFDRYWRLYFLLVRQPLRKNDTP